MKALRLIIPTIAIAIIAPAIVSCGDTDDQTTWEEYTDWREANEAWIKQQAALTGDDGKPLYTAYAPSYSPQGTIYYRFIGDTEANKDNLQPFFTSSATVNYTLHLYDGTRVDSAANYTSTLNSPSLITGWATTIMLMHVGDSIEAILPYGVAYGPSGTGSIKPYSALRYNIKLTDIPAYEIRPKQN